MAKNSPTDLPEPIGRFVEAVNRGDANQVLSFFPDDGVVNDSGRRFVGRDAIGAWSDHEFIGAKGRISVKGVKQRRRTVTVTADWVSNFYTGPARFVFHLDGNMIQEIRITGE